MEREWGRRNHSTISRSAHLSFRFKGKIPPACPWYLYEKEPSNLLRHLPNVVVLPVCESISGLSSLADE
jgi:hypothetical protein